MADKCAWQPLQNLRRPASDKKRYVNFGAFAAPEQHYASELGSRIRFFGAPNIATIYGLEQADGKRFLAMELVEGETLAERIGKAPLPVEETIAVCRQIAEDLEAAHERGVGIGSDPMPLT